MFVLPAILSLLCDCSLLSLSIRHRIWSLTTATATATATAASSDGYKLFAHALIVASVVRVLILAGPLSCTTFTGRRLKRQRLYWAFHAVCLVFMLVGAVRLELDGGGSSSSSSSSSGSGSGRNWSGNGSGNGAWSNLASVDAFDLLGSSSGSGSGSGNSTSDSNASDDNNQDPDDPCPSEQMGMLDHFLWVATLLSLFSITFHALILWHIRTTAPLYTGEKNGYRINGESSLGKGRKKRKMMAYYAYRRYYADVSSNANFSNDAAEDHIDDNEEEEGDEHPLQLQGLGSPSKASPTSKKRIMHKKKHSGIVQYNSIPTADGEDESDVEDPDSGVFRRSNATAANGPVIVHFPPTATPPPSQRHLVRGNSFGDKYDEFMKELFQRLAAAKRQWSSRLDDVQRSLGAAAGGNASSAAAAMELGERSPSSSRQPNMPSVPLVGPPDKRLAHLRYLHLSPFRALLQLYAYEDVFTTGKLDQAFDFDGDASEALVFYAPQILSFLLHNAFDTSPLLERWVLERCRTNLHFAHRCFWFLRSFCLGEGEHPLRFENCDADEEASVGIVGSLGFGREDSISSSVSSLRHALTNSKRRGSESNLYLHDSSSNIDGAASQDGSERRSKYPQEEHQLLEELLLKIIEAGEEAAASVQCGATLQISSSAEEGETTTLSSGRISPEYTDDIVASGWVPVDASTKKPSELHLRCLQSHPPDILPNTSSAEDLFLTAPKFLDALTSLADDLMLVDKSERTKKLRERLERLEIELLPSNCIYFPMQDVRHRAWRIVVDESVALSTNERVPIIITFEVLHTSDNESDEPHPSVDTVARRLLANGRASLQDVTKSEREVLRDWYKSERPPQRHNTLRDKIHELSRKIRHDINDTVALQSDRILEGLRHPRGPNIYTPEVDFDLVEAQGDRLPYRMAADGDDRAELDISRLDHTDDSRPPLPPPPLPPANTAAPVHEGLISRGKTNISSPSSSRASSRPPSPAQMGQWYSPGLEKKNKKKFSIDAGMESIKIQQLTLPSLKTVSRESSLDDALQMPSSDNSTSIVEESQKRTTKKRSRPTVVFKEDWNEKELRLRQKSAFGSDPRWKLLPIPIKSNDDLRQEQLASQIIHQCAAILSRANIPVWLCPYEIIALTDRGGIIEAIPDTISLSSLKQNDPNYVDLKTFFESHFGPPESDDHAGAKANFVESLAAYSMVCYLLQIKDRHNGNILLTNRGHLVHIDFGFFFLSSPGKNSGFESAPFKLTNEFVELMDGLDSYTFDKFRDLCYRTFLELRKNCYHIILVVEMICESGSDLQCFRGEPERAIEELRQRFRLDLNDRACKQYVNSLIDESIGNWRTDIYDRYQRICVGVM